MPLGPGKYDAACTKAREETGGDVLLIVVNGIYGSGFSAQVSFETAAGICGVLRRTADEIERSFPKV